MCFYFIRTGWSAELTSSTYRPTGSRLYPESIYRVSGNGGIPELLVPADDGEWVHGPQILPGVSYAETKLSRKISAFPFSFVGSDPSGENG